MRVQRDQIVGGIPAQIARRIVRRLGSQDSPASAIDGLLAKYDQSRSAEEVIKGLADEGFVELAFTTVSGDWWRTTISGNALAMASFGKPIARHTADRLLAGLLSRTQELNADPAQLLAVERIRVFGSYLRPEIDPLGDIDVELILRRRVSARELIQYGAESGKAFPHYVAQIHWAETEFIQRLRTLARTLVASLT